MSWLGKKELTVASATTFIQSLLFGGLFFASQEIITYLDDSVGLRLTLALAGEALLLLVAWQIFQTFHAPRVVIMIRRAIGLFFTVILVSVLGPIATLGLKSIEFSSKVNNTEKLDAIQRLNMAFESQPTLGILIVSSISIVLLVLYYGREKRIEEAAV